MLARIADREGPGLTALEAVCSGSALFVRLGLSGRYLVFEILKHLSYTRFKLCPGCNSFTRFSTSMLPSNC